MRRTLVVLAAAVLTLSLALAAHAGPSWLYTPGNSYSPGDRVILVGYTSYLDDDQARQTWTGVLQRWDSALATNGPVLEVMPVSVEPAGIGNHVLYRVSVDLRLPTNLQPAEYLVTFLNEGGNADHIGDLYGGVVHVGVEPSGVRYVDWPLDEPLVAELPDDVVLQGPGMGMTAGDLRAGRYPFGAEAFMLDPSILDQPEIEFFGPPATTPVPDPDDPVVTEDLAVAVDSVPAAPPAVTAPVEEEPLPAQGRDLWWLLGLSATAAIALLAAHVWARERAEEVEESEVTSVGVE